MPKDRRGFMPKITVAGSISTDFVVETDKRPSVGETVEGRTFTTSFGGKGANQAIAAARAGAETIMLGAVGDDIFGEKLVMNFEENEVDSSCVERVTQSSGSAFITLSKGDNSIIYIPGANNSYSPAMIDKVLKGTQIIQESDMVLVQNEIPEETVNYLIRKCNKLNIPVLLNPAPARKLGNKLIEQVTILTPNESEFDILFPEMDLNKAVESYPNKLIVTLGSDGAVFHDGQEIQFIPAHKVKNVVDTTGAGDTFNGAFAYAYSSGLSIKNSVRFGNAAAGLSIQKNGAQEGAPSLDQIKSVI